MKTTTKIVGTESNSITVGDVVGPFVVHQMCGTGMSLPYRAKWGVTHAATGYNTAYGPTKACCMHAARLLRDVGVDWSFDKPEAVKSFSKDHLNVIGDTRAACAQGGEA